MHKTKKRWRQSHCFHNKGNYEKSTEHNFAVEANTSSKAGKIFRGDNESLVPKIEWPSSHLVSSSRNGLFDSSSLLGNLTLISHFPLRLSFFFFAAPWGQTVRSWAVGMAEFLSNRGTTGEFQLFPSDAPQHQNVCALSFMFYIFYGAIGTGDIIWMVCRYGRQDHGKFGYRIQRLWICKIIHPLLGCPL